MLKVIIDFLFSEGDTILKSPVPFIVIFVIGFALGSFVTSWSQKLTLNANEARLNANEEIMKLLDKQMKEKDTENQDLKQKLASKGELKDNYNTSCSLNENEIRALKAISIFQKENPCQEGKSPPEYSVDNLIKDLQIDWNEANHILKKLRMLLLFESIWDNMTKYTNLAKPINETSPGRLSKTGQEFLSNYKSGN
jgi:hypothetical protein